MEYSGAEILIKLLERQGIDIIAGIPGGTNLPIYDALGKSSITHILARHEQGAGFMAQGMARTTGLPGVCLATSGPGSTNLVTAIADANMDSIPVIAISGQTPLSLIGSDAFQEIDTYGISLPITKHNFLVRSAEELLHVIPKSFEIAMSGRPGPVWIDIPKDVQTSCLFIDKWPEPGEKVELECDCEDEIIKAAGMINQSKKPIFYAGGGLKNSGAKDFVKDICNKNSIPIVSTLMGLGIVDTDSRDFIGMLGMHGFRATNMILDKADLIIAAGARFDDRATGKVESFCKNAKIIHIDIDGKEIDKIKKCNCSIKGDASLILEKLIPSVLKNQRKEWMDEIAKIKEENPKPCFNEDEKRPEYMISRVAKHAQKDSFIVTDVGQHQMWTAQFYPFSRPDQFLTSGGLGTMGFCIPAAIGAALKNRDKQIICFTGDGSILMNLQEFATLSENNLNVKIILLNNGSLGLVRQQQELFFNSNYTSSKFDYNPDFLTIAKGFGIFADNIDPGEYGNGKIKTFLSQKGPGLLNVPINPDANVFPMVPPGGSNTNMIGGN